MPPLPFLGSIPSFYLAASSSLNPAPRNKNCQYLFKSIQPSGKNQGLRTKPVCVSSSMPSTVSKFLHRHHFEPFLPSMLLGTFLPISQSVTHEPRFEIPKLTFLGCLPEIHSQMLDVRTIQEPVQNVKSVADVDLPSAVAEKNQREFSFERTSGFLIEGISAPKVNFESPVFPLSLRLFMIFKNV